MRVSSRSHTRFHLVVGAVVVALLSSLASVAQAVPLPVGTTIVAAAEPDPIGGAVLAASKAPISAATFTGTLVSTVISGDTTNPFGGLTFTYQISNDASSAHAIERLTVNSFASFLTDASYQAVPGGPPPAGVAPSLVDRSVAPGDVVGFSFIAHIGPPVDFGNGVIPPGGTSAVLVIQTNALNYQPTKAAVIDGSVAQVDSFAPLAIPEPGTLVLAATALVGLSILGWRRR